MKAKQLLEQDGVNITESRVDVVDIVSKSKKPIDSATIVEMMQKKSPQTNRATIFRAIQLLSEKGVLTKCEFEEGKLRYELSSLPHHHHIVCTTCGKVEDVEGCEISDVEGDLAKRYGFTIRSHKLEFFGQCKKCR